MLNTVQKISSRPTCNRNVLEKFIGFAPFWSHQPSLFCYPPGQSQCRSFFLLSNGCLFNSTNRVLAASDNYHVPIEKSNEMTYFWEDYSKKLSFKRRCINKVSTLLDCEQKEAAELVEEHPVLFLEDIDHVWENINLLTENGISTDMIKENIWLLYFNLDDLQSRITLIKQWNIQDYEIKDFLPLFKLSPIDFQRTSDTIIEEKDRIPYGNRIIYLAHFLQVSVPVLVSRLARHKYVLYRNIDLIVESIKCYFEFGITGKDLVDDIWALRYSEGIIRRRLRIAKENDIPQLKAWFVRCSEEKFDRTLEIFRLEKTMMHPFETREEFIANKLKLDVSEIKAAIQKDDIFLTINIVKLDEMINCLLSAGFTSKEICTGCRVFHFGVELTKARIVELKSLGVEKLSITMLILNENEFRKVIQRIQRINSLRQNLT